MILKQFKKQLTSTQTVMLNLQIEASSQWYLLKSLGLKFTTAQVQKVVPPSKFSKVICQTPVDWMWSPAVWEKNFGNEFSKEKIVTSLAKQFWSWLSHMYTMAWKILTCTAVYHIITDCDKDKILKIIY